MYHPQAYFVMFVNGEAIMHCMEWPHYEEEVNGFSAQKRHSDRFTETFFFLRITVMKVSSLIVHFHPVLSLKIHGGYFHSFCIPS